jgi:3-hydroxy-5-methyl-1-naphthoate 3-O-methyltransferase
MAKSAAKIPPPVDVANDLLWGGWRTFAVAAALELDVFTAIKNGAATAAQIASSASAHESAMRRLLDTLVSIKYLTRKGERYALTPQAATYLTRGSELYMDSIDRFVQMQLMGWPQLAEAVRSGHPSLRADDAGRGAFFATLVKCIFPVNFGGAKAAAASLSSSNRSRIKRVLDVAAGAAAWSIPFAQVIRGAKVTVVDLPEVTQVTREYTSRFGVGDRYDYIEGDLRELDFGRGYDLVLLGHIIHGEGRDAGRKLIERSAAALGDRGMLLIAELVPNDERSGPPLPMLFGLNMLLHTPDGDVFTMKEYREWLKAAGFKQVKTIRTPMAPSPLILAQK